MQQLEKPQRVNLDGIICEYLLSPESDRAIILLEGLPAIPQRIEFMNSLREGGYSVFYPRFRGTWESSGTFLKESPVLDVLEVATRIYEGVDLEQSVRYKSSTIHVLATSFAGAVSLSLPKREFIQKIISLSPVFDFTKVASIQTLKLFLRNLFTMAYRFDDNRWEDLIHNKIVAPVYNFDSATTNQHLVITGALDDQISMKELEVFCSERSIQIKIYPGVGHISYSKMSKEILKDILSFFE